MPRLFILSVALLMTATAAHSQEGTFPGIEALMTPEEYKAAGIDTLSPEQRAALNRFLIRFTAQDSEVLRNTDEEVIKAAEEQAIVSRISGDFKGWSGDTVFKLENGQIWQQRRRGNYRHVGEPNPEIKISKNFLGFYRLEILENGKSVQVKRVR